MSNGPHWGERFERITIKGDCARYRIEQSGFCANVGASCIHHVGIQPGAKSAFNQFKSREYDAEASSGAYLPKIDLDAGIGYEAINPAESSGNRNTDLTRKDATLTLTQLIWDGSATLNDMDRTAAEAEADRYQLLADASNMALEVAKIYLDATKASEILTLSENNLAIHKDIYRDIKSAPIQGLALRPM